MCSYRFIPMICLLASCFSPGDGVDLAPDASSESSGTTSAEGSMGEDVEETSGGNEPDASTSSDTVDDDTGSTSDPTGGSDASSTGEATDECAGEPEAFDVDPGWEAIGLPDGGNDYGWSSSTAHAGGMPGEIGGVFQRSSNATSYAVSVEARGAMDCIVASGRMVVTHQDPDFDQGVRFGHFSRTSGAFVGFDLNEGDDGTVRMFLDVGSVHMLAFLIDDPGTPHVWSYTYDPVAATMALEVEGLGTFTHELTAEETEAIIDLDTFGLWTVAAPEPETLPGLLGLWIDDVVYTR